MALPMRRRRDDASNGVARDPIEELDRLNHQLANLVDHWSRLPALLNGGFTPLADLEETSDAYLVEIELPGIKRDDIDIEISGRRLCVRGERKEKERVGILRRRERKMGGFTYEVVLPGAVSEDAVEANMSGGVLTIRLPKPDADKPRRIQIQPPNR